MTAPFIADVASIAGATNLTFTGPGDVAVVASQAGNGSWNPAPNVTNTYSVSKASATVTLGNLDQAYDGTARPVTVATAPAGLGVTVTYAGHSWAPTNVGTYAVTATVSDAVYQGSGSGTLTVTEAIQPGTVSSNAVVVTFGPLVNGSNYVLEYRASLTTGTWVEVTNVTGTGTANTTVTNVTGAADFGYYRVEGVTGPSAELLGYARVDKPGNGKLNVVGVPFLSSNQTLNSLMDPLQFTGHYNNAGQADQLMLWNPATTSYVNLALYDLRSFGAQYDYLTGWKAVAGFGPTSAYVNVTLKPGDGFWFRAVNGSFTWVETNDYKAGLE